MVASQQQSHSGEAKYPDTPSQCSLCAEAGLTERMCVRGDCNDGCGDCRELWEAAHAI